MTFQKWLYLQNILFVQTEALVVSNQMRWCKSFPMRRLHGTVRELSVGIWAGLVESKKRGREKGNSAPLQSELQKQGEKSCPRSFRRAGYE